MRRKNSGRSAYIFLKKKLWSFELQPPWKSGLFFTSFPWICFWKWCFYFSLFQYGHFNTVLRPYCCHKNAHRRKMSHKPIQNDLATVSRGEKKEKPTQKNVQLFVPTICCNNEILIDICVIRAQFHAGVPVNCTQTEEFSYKNKCLPPQLCPF